MSDFTPPPQPSTERNDDKKNTDLVYRGRMLAHTTVRNVGLYTGTTLASLAAARILLGRKRYGSAQLLFAASVLFLIVAVGANMELVYPYTNHLTPYGDRLQAEAINAAGILPYLLATGHLFISGALAIAIKRALEK